MVHFNWQDWFCTTANITVAVEISSRLDCTMEYQCLSLMSALELELWVDLDLYPSVNGIPFSCIGTRNKVNRWYFISKLLVCFLILYLAIFWKKCFTFIMFCTKMCQCQKRYMILNADYDACYRSLIISKLRINNLLSWYFLTRLKQLVNILNFVFIIYTKIAHVQQRLVFY